MKFGTPRRWAQALLIVSLVSAAVPLTGCAAGITEEDACRILNCDTFFFVGSLIVDMNADDMHDDTDHDDMDMDDMDMGDDDMHDDDEVHDGDEEGEDEHEEGGDQHDEAEEEHEEEGGGLA